MLAIVGDRVLISARDRHRDVEEFIISIRDDFAGEISGNKIINIVIVFLPKTTQLFPSYRRYTYSIILYYYDPIGKRDLYKLYMHTL